ncbi:MAG: efflux transporter outer membrane subunit [Betaproteobacteria bacterium]|nr:efflux transporter outer membrane subunit [Betaproteobacteria bacterium]
MPVVLTRAARRCSPAWTTAWPTSWPTSWPTAWPTLCTAVVLPVLLAACTTAGPEYRKPVLDMPAAWKVEAPWRESTPNDTAAKGPWWQRFGDPRLDALEQQALANSPTLALASARLAQAGAVLAAVSASLYPQASLVARDQRTRISANRPLNNNIAPNFSTTQTDMVGALSASYEVDLAGRVRRTIEGARASAEQSAADFENIRLLLTADVATAYFNLRALDIELDVLSRAIGLQRRSLALATARHELGAASGLDPAQQQALLDGTLTQVDVLRRQRAQFEHAIATLTGTPAPLFSLSPEVKALAPPVVPIGLPSDLLERRPDVAAAERAMAAANAQIGVASAAYYPSITLGGLYGTEARLVSGLFTTAGYIWSLGAALAQPLFDGGRIDANVDNARAAYDGTVANYRRVVLTAMQEAEDGIIGLAALERAHVQAQVAIASATRVFDLANSRYEGGVATSLDVITAQQALLTSERLAAQLLGQRLLTSVFLVKALGGGWEGAKKVAAE